MSIQRIVEGLPRIPASRRAACFHCQSPLDINSPGTYTLTVGWTRQRAQGGTNQVTLAEHMRVWCCRDCIDRLRAGVGIDQLAMFDERTGDAG